jgi:GxxExxY protein
MAQEGRKLGRFGDGTDEVIGALLEVHRHLGPGLMESAYEACLSAELSENDGSSSSGSDRYQSATKAYTLTAPIASTWSLSDRILLELKAVERLLPIHEAQVITYPRLSRLPVGLLVNFRPADANA